LFIRLHIIVVDRLINRIANEQEMEGRGCRVSLAPRRRNDVIERFFDPLLELEKGPKGCSSKDISILGAASAAL
jgi:hypothetical protein